MRRRLNNERKFCACGNLLSSLEGKEHREGSMQRVSRLRRISSTYQPSLLLMVLTSFKAVVNLRMYWSFFSSVRWGDIMCSIDQSMVSKSLRMALICSRVFVQIDAMMCSWKVAIWKLL